MLLSTLLLSLTFAEARPLRVDSCALVPPTGPAPAWFDFQVERPVRFLGAERTGPQPDVSLNRMRPFPDDFALAQFIVDTLGSPLPRSLKLLVQPAALAKDSVQAALPGWRFEPAMKNGLPVDVGAVIEVNLRLQ